MNSNDSQPFQPVLQPSANLMPVRFDFWHPTASEVLVAGTFNDWNGEAKILVSAGDGHWWKVAALPPGKYEYRLIVDGDWMEDPRAEESIANPFGGRNSVLTVEDAELPHLKEAQDIPMKMDF